MKTLLCVLLAWMALSGAGTPAPAVESPEEVDLGSRRELFVDDFLIESMRDVSLRLHPPVSAGSVFAFDRPWEGHSSTYVTVLRDGGRFRMYYRGSNREHPGGLKPGETAPPVHPEVIATAESVDGSRWTRPALGIFEFQGSKENNIVWMDKPRGQKISISMFVFKDENPAAPPAQRYKALGGKFPLIALVSEDGYRWKELQGEKPLITEGLHGNAFDSLTTAFWDGVRGRYVMIFRDADAAAGTRDGNAAFNYGIRSFKCSTSPDFIHWSRPEWADFGSTPAEHLYTNSATAYFRAPQIYLAFPKRFLPWRTFFEGWTPGASDGVFMSSRDGVHWDRRFMEAFVRPGRDARNWGHRSNMAAAGILQTAPDELSLYYARHYAFPSCHLERLVLRVDGFASVHAGFTEGEFVTRPITFQGSALHLNFATSAAGGMRLEIQDLAGHALPGLSLEESPLIWGDEVDAPVVWKRPSSNTDPNPLRRLRGKPVRLRFVMKDADLYSLQFR